MRFITFLLFLSIYYFIITGLKPYFGDLKYINRGETNIFFESFEKYNIKFINSFFNTAPTVIEWIMTAIVCIFVLSIIILVILWIIFGVFNFLRNTPRPFQ